MNMCRKIGKLISILLLITSLVSSMVFLAMGAGRRPPRRANHGNLAVRPNIQGASENSEAIDFEESTTSIIASKTSAHKEALPSSRFRGLNGTGIYAAKTIPIRWSDQENLRWKVKLDGPGSSSPILTDSYVFVTSYSGYGDEETSKGRMEDLRRNLHCIDRKSGEIVWTKSVQAVMPEDPYQGMGLPEHGYATNTPVTDGEVVYCFFGKSGVFAYDLNGNQLWHAMVGNESGSKGWGTSSSLILYKHLVIVNASEESQSIVALDRSTGKTVWTAPASSLEQSYGTPVLVQVDENRDDLVLAVPGEVWGLNPNTGKLTWYVETALTGNVSPSVIPDKDRIYVFGGYRSSGSLAIQAGGTGNVTKSHLLWTSRNSSYVVTPVLFNENLIWIDDQGMYFCISAKTGELVEKKRVPNIKSGGRPVYASPVAINESLYMQTRQSGLFVLDSKPGLNVLSRNVFESDESIFNATPAVDAEQLFLRSNRYLYCVEKQSK